MQIQHRVNPLSPAWLLVLCAFSYPSHAQFRWEDESGRRLKAAQQIGPLTDAAFGDQISLFNGTVSFSATDIDLPGNSTLPVRLARTYDTQEISMPSLIGDWDIDIPNLSAIHSTRAEGGWAPLQRCSHVSAPPVQNNGSIDFDHFIFWSGTQLRSASGAGDLHSISADSRLPTPSSSSELRWNTNKDWFFSCLPSIKNGLGEGFLGHAPDGTKYYFDWLVMRNYGSIVHPFWTQPLPGSSVMHRKNARLFVTRVEDRFGNWVNYEWSGNKLTRIYANDGREIVLNYIEVSVEPYPLLSTATAHGRTWHYSFSGLQLASVTQPDGHRWQYSHQGPRLDGVTYQLNRWNYLIRDDELHCSPSHKLASYTSTYSITHPSGAKADYIFSPMRHGRKSVPNSCFYMGEINDAPDSLRNFHPTYRDVHSLITKKISGPGLADASYHYRYYPLSQGYAALPPGNPMPDGGPGNGYEPPPNYKYVTVTDPQGVEQIYKFDKDAGPTEGKLYRVETRKDGVFMRSIDHIYVTSEESASMPFPNRRGFTFAWLTDDQEILPLKKSIITQQGVTFSRTIDSFDAYARPTKLTLSSQP